MITRKGRSRVRTVSWLGLILASTGIALGRPDPSVLITKDVSPDSPFGTPFFDEKHGTTSGRVNGIAVDPSNDLVVYAASEWAGVWRSIDGGQSWAQSSEGLRSGNTVSGVGPVVASEGYSPRVLYITQPKDGRPSSPCTVTQNQCGHFGGLWASSDRAASWHHVDPPLCAYPTIPNLNGVGFSGGTAFALVDTAACRLVSSSDAALTTWTNLPDPPFPMGGDHFSAATGPTPVLFACQGGFVWRTVAPDTPGSWVALVIPFNGYLPVCDGIASLPATATVPPGPGSEPKADTVIVSTSGTDSNGFRGRDVYVVNFTDSTVTGLGTFSTDNSGSGVQNVFAAPYASPVGQYGPGLSYDVFAADKLRFWKYDGNGNWNVLPGPLHVDTWSMSFPPSYDPPHGHCSGLASNDGGVWIGCGDQGDWALASAGLRVLWPNAMAGVARPIDPVCFGIHQEDRSPCPTLYLPTTDNDSWVSDSGGFGSMGPDWTYLNDNLGDAGEVLVDPAVANMALAFRGPPGYHFKISPDSAPPDNFSGFQDLTFTNAFIGSQDGIQGGLSQVLTLPQHSFDRNDFFALQGGPRVIGQDGTTDSILRNETAGLAGGPGQWQPVTTSDQPFGPGMIQSLGAGGGHAAPTLYVLTTNSNIADYSHSKYSPSRLYKGEFSPNSPTFTPHWLGASGYGFPSNLLKSAYSLAVNPYDPGELYVTDLGDSSIRVSRDGGTTWTSDPVLKDVATNHGEFDFDCGNFPFNILAPRHYGDKEIFGNQCPLMQVVFVRDHPEIRVAVLYPGGVAFSRDQGRHWIPLHVTHEDAAEQPIELPASAFYDPTPRGDRAHKNTYLYVALEGRGLKRVEGPFATLESGKITFCLPCVLPPMPGFVQVLAIIDEPLSLGLSMHPIGEGVYQADFPFDSETAEHVAYRIVVDGARQPEQVQALTHDDVSTGVVALTNLPPASISMGVAAVGANWVDLFFRNDGPVRLPRVDLESIRVSRGGSGSAIPTPDHRPLGELLSGESTTIRIFVPHSRRGGFEIESKLFVEDLAERETVLTLSAGSGGTSR